MSYVEDTQIKDGNYKPGTLLDDGKWRVEFDSMGQVKVPADRLWGAQTQRSLIHFSIGNDHMPTEVYHAYGIVKKAAALVNGRSGRLPQDKADLIGKAADEVIAGKLDEDFPLFVWQTGSGTQSNMNVNEVISNRAIQMVKGTLGAQEPVHPNDHVNMSQSSNDTFPTAMHIAAVKEIRETLLPKVGALTTAIEDKANEWEHIIKIGRTHLEDAVPLTVGQEWSGYAAQMRDALARVEESLTGLYKLAVGGTAVGTGLNSPVHFDVDMAIEIAKLTTYPFITAPNKFAAQGSLDAMVAAHAALRGLAVSLMKIANDMRWLASGPALRHRRAHPAGERTRLLHHAGQGQSDRVRGDGHDLHPGDRGRCGGGVRRLTGQFRAERDAAHHHQQFPAFGPHSGRWLREAPYLFRRRHAWSMRRRWPSTSRTRSCWLRHSAR